MIFDLNFYQVIVRLQGAFNQPASLNFVVSGKIFISKIDAYLILFIVNLYRDRDVLNVVSVIQAKSNTYP